MMHKLTYKAQRSQIRHVCMANGGPDPGLGIVVIEGCTGWPGCSGCATFPLIQQALLQSCKGHGVRVQHALMLAGVHCG
jgi:hypothetical protein